MIMFMTSGLIYGFNYAISAPYFLIKATSVKGCRELTEKEVLALAALKSSQTIFSVNMEAMARRIASQPWVKNVAIGREFPNRLVVEVQERTALALCRKEEDLYLFDQDGVFFKKLEAGDEVDVPVLTGYYQEGQLNKELFEKTHAAHEDSGGFQKLSRAQCGFRDKRQRCFRSFPVYGKRFLPQAGVR